MDLDEIKRGLRAEIKKRENEQYFTFQCNVRQMCKDVLAKLEEQESEIAELEERIADGDKDFEMAAHRNERLLQIVCHQKRKRCLAQVENCRTSSVYFFHLCERAKDEGKAAEYRRVSDWFDKWEERWLELADKFKEEA